MAHSRRCQPARVLSQPRANLPWVRSVDYVTTSIGLIPSPQVRWLSLSNMQQHTFHPSEAGMCVGTGRAKKSSQVRQGRCKAQLPELLTSLACARACHVAHSSYCPLSSSCRSWRPRTPEQRVVAPSFAKSCCRRASPSRPARELPARL